ncbi:MAG TPA: hypothetical protein VEL07_16415 [Planctomycetota bacterium]|nr:hypothetical protein [Planctomycetota bacterium]
MIAGYVLKVAKPWRSRHRWRRIGFFINRLRRPTLQYECALCGVTTDDNGRHRAGMIVCARVRAPLATDYDVFDNQDGADVKRAA